ncbi:PQ-loop domain-containing transporter (plasmid) [Aneurinibacillus sp. Ricciae_BoGa-3]|uniref:PQ-loop domain-containing transporter n=1 Tax=Aneurinibacillus sp. Ricciae_BoGa-3 TaxID=3022697 RepID=UPI00233FE743|nr:PQ-loop domain-containing transporter [Aneurinibacillus sp. Ricciae_BoGa-3]WCK57606.1 PQ-loop domain-containing transporter [Aneurinibacillus sp. Ricciae_BoGa-3]
MNFFDVLQLMGGIILSVGNIPQIVKILKTKSVGDFHLSTYCLFLFGMGLMEVYGIYLVIHHAGMAFLLTNSLSLVIDVIMLTLLMVYRTQK